MTKISDIFGKELTVINVGLASMAESVKDQGIKTIDLDWTPPQRRDQALAGDQNWREHQ